MFTEILLLSLLSSFAILLITKIGLRERAQIYAPRLLSEMFGCDFCLSFWTCAVFSILFFIFVDRDWIVLSYPIFASPIVRRLI